MRLAPLDRTRAQHTGEGELGLEPLPRRLEPEPVRGVHPRDPDSAAAAIADAISAGLPTGTVDAPSSGGPPRATQMGLVPARRASATTQPASSRRDGCRRASARATLASVSERGREPAKTTRSAMPRRPTSSRSFTASRPSPMTSSLHVGSKASAWIASRAPFHGTSRPAKSAVFVVEPSLASSVTGSPRAGKPPSSSTTFGKIRAFAR